MKLHYALIKYKLQFCYLLKTESLAEANKHQKALMDRTLNVIVEARRKQNVF